MSENRKARVLLVDDEAHVRLYIRTVVTSLGFEVVAEAGDGRQGLELFEQHAPDLVLLDLNMPVMDGVATLKALRQKSDQVAIVMITSLASLDVVEECLDLGADYHLRKDLPVSELRQEILEAWQAHVEDLRQGTDPA
jgi:CheY-like chemotaxis protein